MITTFDLNVATKDFQVYSNLMSQIGTSDVSLTGKLTSYPTQTSLTPFTVTVKNPCEITTLTSSASF